MSDTTKPLPPLAEVFLAKAIAFEELAQHPNAVAGQKMRDAEASKCFAGAAEIAAPYDAELARLREERAKLRSRVAELLRDNRYSRAHSRRLRETIGEVVGVLEEGTVPVESEVAKMAANVVAQNVMYLNLAGEAACMIADLEDEEFRAECMARLGKDSKALIEDAATLILRLAETMQGVRS